MLCSMLSPNRQHAPQSTHPAAQSVKQKHPRRLEEEVEYESESSSGGFSSSYDCISSEEAETDLSSVSERETDVEDSEVNDEEKRVNRKDIK